MYEKPIEIMFGEIQTKIIEQGEAQIMQAVQNCGVSVDKEELTKALMYDRQQYEKGYADAKAEQRWIPTKIAKPPKAGQYLVTKQQKTGVCQIATAHYNPSFDEWSGNGNFKKILAWQPLPSPYKQE